MGGLVPPYSCCFFVFPQPFKRGILTVIVSVGFPPMVVQHEGDNGHQQDSRGKGDEERHLLQRLRKKDGSIQGFILQVIPKIQMRGNNFPPKNSFETSSSVVSYIFITKKCGGTGRKARNITAPAPPLQVFMAANRHENRGLG